MQAVSPLFKHIFYPLALIEKNSRKWTFSKIEYELLATSPAFLAASWKCTGMLPRKGKRKCGETRGDFELQKMKSVVILFQKWLFNNFPRQLTGKGVDYWLGAASKQNWNTYSVPSWDAEQVWAEASGIRAPILDKEAITQRTHGRHISTSTSAGSMRHFWSLPWQGTLKFGTVLSERSREGAYRWMTAFIRNINRHALSLIPHNQEDAEDLYRGNAIGQGLAVSLLVGSRWDESFPRISLN